MALRGSGRVGLQPADLVASDTLVQVLTSATANARRSPVLALPKITCFGSQLRHQCVGQKVVQGD